MSDVNKYFNLRINIIDFDEDNVYLQLAHDKNQAGVQFDLGNYNGTTANLELMVDSLTGKIMFKGKRKDPQTGELLDTWYYLSEKES